MIRQFLEGKLSIHYVVMDLKDFNMEAQSLPTNGWEPSPIFKQKKPPIEKN